MSTVNNRRQHPQTAIEQRGVFMQQAKRIGYDLSQTFLKLEQLTLIAKQSSLFNDKSMEIQDLTLSIKQDISHLNREIAKLQHVDLVFFNHAERCIGPFFSVYEG